MLRVDCRLLSRAVLAAAILVSTVQCGEETVRGAVGGSVSLTVHIPDIHTAYRVEWRYSPQVQPQTWPIAELSQGKIKIDFEKRFTDRLQLDVVSGSLTITDLHSNDSGLYLVQTVDGLRFQTIFNLTVYKPVSTPQVIIYDRNSSLFNRTELSVNCILLCSVANGREVTLSWYREGEEKPLNHSSSPDLNTPLTLPLETEGLSHFYSCVSSNPVTKKEVTLTSPEHCLHKDPKARASGSATLWTVVLIIAVMLSVCVLLWTVFRRRRSGTGSGPVLKLVVTGEKVFDVPDANRRESVQYSDVQIILVPSEESDPQVVTD
ncbi:CD48 antigen isoform X2 [Amia ocellicauda]|uniref:CD48 antigen isoform X2 n=1 Tax=Amia ocellicauda TaxID=2972642 RepID=UPI003463AFF0